jgi:outer membrane protein assembly factor BamB
MEESEKDKEENGKQTVRRSLRLWPGVIAVVLLWLARFGLKIVIPGFEGFEIGILGGFLGAMAVVIWWVFFSRAHYLERWGAIILMIIVMFVTWHVNHESMGPLWIAGYAVPTLFLAFVTWAVVTRQFSDKLRRITMVATIVLACGAWTFVRTSGINSNHVADFAWRWSESAEEQLLDQSEDFLTTLPDTAVVMETDAEWPGFRGPERNSIIRGVQIETDWSAFPPVELWRRPIGPGWSSFAVCGDLFYTQEQRGEDEIIACYIKRTGDPLWRHRNTARFFESNAGAGPRGTPTLSHGRVYALGATGILNALDARTGAVIWSRNAASDTGTEIPMWGFSCSPLVVDDVIIVAAASSLIAYDLTTGNPRWVRTSGTDGYSSPHLLTINDVKQIVLLNETGAISVTQNDGNLLWDYPWPGVPIVQPAITANGDILITASERSGIRRISVKKGLEGWTTKEHWTSTRLKPYFNDFVIYQGYAYGIHGRSLSCIDLNDGLRKWKGEQYGGQLLLLADQDLLLILSEKGDLVLAGAVPDQFTEIARFPAITGKTWNHPVLVGDVLLIRNAQEMAAFRLSLYNTSITERKRNILH